MKRLTEKLRERRSDLVDPIVTVAVVALAIVGLAFDSTAGDSDPNAIGGLFVVLAAGAGWFRRRNSIQVLAITGAAHVLLTWATGNDVALLPAVVVAMFTVARHADRKLGLTVASLAGLAIAAVTARADGDPFVHEFLSEIAPMAVPIAIGDAARTRADRVRDLIDTEANSRVQAERIRIARDLHDVVAHGLSTIAIQSGVAAHLLDRDPGQAKEALEVINATGKSSLEELRAMVGVLRSTDHAPLRPTPNDPNDLTDLLDGAAKGGVDVTVSIEGAFPPQVGDSCVVALHRIVQEALTNVARHAGAAATLDIAHATDHVEVSIANQAGALSTSGPESTGVGITGMRERAVSLGGTLVAGPTENGGFLVTAVLPYNLSRETP